MNRRSRINSDSARACPDELKEPPCGERPKKGGRAMDRVSANKSEVTAISDILSKRGVTGTDEKGGA